MDSSPFNILIHVGHVGHVGYQVWIQVHLIYHNQRENSMKLIKQMQYNAALIVSGSWQGTSRSKLYDELVWESLPDRRWARRLTTLYKILNGLAPSYFSEHLPIEVETNISLCTQSKRAPISGTVMHENSFFPYCITNWRDLDGSVKSIPSLTLFKIHFSRPKANILFGIQDKNGTNLLTIIRVF